MRTVVRLAALIAASVAGLSGQSRAGEPQILGVIASASPLPMLCDGAACTAQASTFCLQRNAAVPERGTPYVLAGAPGDGIKLEGHAPDGTVVALPVSLLSLTSARANRAIELSVPASDLAARGIDDVAVTIGEGVSAIPASLYAQSDDPVVAEEIATVTGALREVGSRLVDAGGVRIGAARLLGQLVNAIPDDRVGDVPDRQGLWGRVLNETVDGAAADDARSRFERCAELPGAGFVTFRECLASHHDMLINPLNRNYWQAVDTGS